MESCAVNTLCISKVNEVTLYEVKHPKGHSVFSSVLTDTELFLVFVCLRQGHSVTKSSSLNFTMFPSRVNNMRFEVLLAVQLKSQFFWDVTLCC